ncbi:MAG: hypothetical protein IJQ60_15795 [Prevotella sp.]|nr:hypothetical protein [Prevotella sp.]
MKKVMNRIWMLAVLTIVSMAATAQVKIDLNESYTGGSISANQAEASEDGSVLVTLTVAPAEGYYIAKKDIKVVSTVAPGGTRAPEVVGDIELSGDDPEDLTLKRDYTFTVKAGLGAWVKEANFHVVEVQPEPGPGPQEPTNDISAEGSNVTWSYDADNGTMMITGEGSTVDFGGETDPWASVRAQVTSVVIEKGVTSIGANIFAGCTSLTSIRIDNANQVLKMGEGAIPANEGLKINVPANLLTEYNITDGWKDFTMGSENAVRMDNIKFSASNEYDTFAASETIVVPSVLKAYAITGINETNLSLTEVKVITSGMAVLVYNAKEIPSDVTIYTAPTDEEPSRTTSLLKVAQDEGKGGHEVSLGDAYILYNDVFYYSQAGVIPTGNVYLQATSEMRTRGSYSLHGDGTTAIAPIYNNKVEGQSAWYTLDGRQLPTAPTKKGLYIKNGKKVVIK